MSNLSLRFNVFRRARDEQLSLAFFQAEPPRYAQS